jgi:lipopolysaccharide export system permease protein
MPILWRYLLRSYLQVFTLCVLSFIAVLFVMRFQDIAHFATLNSDGMSILLFSLYQIPYLLPNAIPIACVIASMLLFQRLSQQGELTALRAAGLGLKKILFPLCMAGTLLSCLNFTIVSELTPHTKFLSKELSYKMMSGNPFYIFNKISEGKLKNAYVDMRQFRGGKRAKDVLLIMNNKTNGRLGIITAKDLSLEGDSLLGKDVTIISSVDSKISDGFDHLIIENQVAMSTKAENLSNLLHDGDWHMGIEYLPFRMVLARSSPKQENFFKSSTGLEIARRLSISLTPLAFTLMGAAFGMEIGRRQTKWGIVWAVILSALYLACFVGAKSLKHSPWTAWSCFFFPFVLITLFSIRSLKNVSRGIE